MSDRITFYHNPMSRGRIVHWMLEEVGAPYDVTLLDFAKGETKTKAFLAVNPMGKIPAIVDRGTVVTEAAAICAYLADAYPEKRLAPGLSDPKRGVYLRWLFFGAGCIEPALLDKMLARPVPERTSAVGYGTYDDAVSTLESAVKQGPYLLGERFSAADVYIASQIGWGMMVKSLEPRPAFQAYLDRCKVRPAFQRFVARDEEFARQMKA